ncbi:hypothetical protein Aperf_G00000037606 [Anoplocephala perfoliata]
MPNAESIQSICPDCIDELTILESAFPDEMKLDLCNGGINVDVLLVPGVIGVPVNVCLKLRVFLSPKVFFIVNKYFQYPRVSPVAELHDPVGLSDSDLTKLKTAIQEVIRSLAGDCVIFPLIDCCREFISNNIPSVECSICLDGFQTEEEVYRSQCNHFFHKNCLSEYHSSLFNIHETELCAILEKNPHCPKKMRPVLKFPCPLCKTELSPLIDVPKSSTI